MCGIAGIAARSPVAADRLADMARRQAHRGPDGFDLRLTADGRAGLAMNLLAVLDPTARPGPYEDPSTGMVLTFNGEIYNYRELADRWGIALRAGETDAHLMLRAYARFGSDCLAHFDGMFALALLDPRNRRLFLARDRFGEKPLYYTATRDTFAFASEVKALRAAVPLRPRFVAEWLAVENPLGSMTPYEDVELLEPGHHVTVDLDSLSVTKQAWWTLEPRSEFDEADDYAQSYKAFAHQLTAAVELRRTDAPSALMASGGLDSAVLAYLLRPSVMLTARYPGYQRYDEFDLAKQVADEIGAELIAVEPTPEDFRRHAADIVETLDYPLGNASLLSERMLCAAAAERGVKVVYGGTGPDELLLGYVRNLLALDGGRAVDDPNLDTYGPLKEKFLGSVGPSSSAADRYYRLILRGPDTTGRTRQYVHGCFDRTPDLGQAISLVEIGVALPSMLLASDKLASAYGLERRSPYLAHEWAQLCYALPLAHKRAGLQSKRPLRDFARELGVPAAIWSRVDKRGFASPVPSWLSGSLAPWYEEQLRVLRRPDAPRTASMIADLGARRAGQYDRSRLHALQVALWWSRETGKG
ncbi:asparagine synthase (glutamine-hydrolyzing) [Actinospica durhamensis]|uniref:asparagine synthase (glutamine-hydrolyzing) n=1 Tax=Actinospica durhamensis TaxID=1508375 RepID=A0A941EJQ2_9ACTN|nr:asparagine synthase (glutamine-hydrolyzing) [Actinospica durhamensis]